jgi:GNAT superfamily N-acetyltransferase
MDEIEIGGHCPGCIGRVVQLHAEYYAANWQFGLYFEAKVAVELAEFLQRFDGDRDGFWTALRNGRVEGAVGIDGSPASERGAYLRWFIVSDAQRGQGVGRRLLGEALGFCRTQGYERVFLWTFEGLSAARHLYEQAGFRLEFEAAGDRWGARVIEQRFALDLRSRTTDQVMQRIAHERRAQCTVRNYAKATK